MTDNQAISFANKIVGSELCTGAGEDEAASYFMSPIARAFIEGAIGADNTPGSMYYAKTFQLKALAEFFVECGEALKKRADKIEGGVE